ncbi:MAG: mycofactocin precursor MftA [Acidimicrobiia bacterium]
MEQDTNVAVADTAADTVTGSEAVAADPVAADLVEEELLIEEISIDGMCGVY